MKSKNLVKLCDKFLEETHENFFDNIDQSDIRFDHYLDFGYFLANKIYKNIPSEYHDDDIYKIELLDFLKKKGKVLNRRISNFTAESDLSDVSYAFLYKELIILLNFNSYVSPKSIDKQNKENDSICIKGLHIFHKLDSIIPINEFKKFKIEKREIPKIGIIKQTKFGPQVSWKTIESKNEFDVDSYNDDFPKFYDDLVSKLQENKNGLYLFYGEPGTGKSSAIRHLISQVKRQFVFIPPQMINYLSNPEFTDLVTNSLKDCILIIEDAEKALMKRESQDGFFNSELVSSLLNLTDGLYADIANTSILATYNCDRNLIDPALLRKGRLKSEYKFDRLTIKKSQNLIDKLGVDLLVDEPMTIADIYNHDKQYSNELREIKKRFVGFGK